MTEERWEPIREFPTYEVSDLGRVVNAKTEAYVLPSYTMQGDLKIGFFDGEKQHTRLLKKIVAETFVPREDEQWNTPILLDGQPENCEAINIMWRPRYFAWHYRRQFRSIPEYYRLGYVVEIDNMDVVVDVWEDTLTAGMSNGLLFRDIWQSIHEGKLCFPTGTRFQLEK